MANESLNNFDFNTLTRYYSSEYNLLVSVGLCQGFELEEIKDVIHQLFLDFAQKKIDLHMVANPTAYIVTSFKRRLIDIHRNNTRRAEVEMTEYQDKFQESVEKMMELNEATHAIAARLLSAYEQLPDRCKKVIHLKYYIGLSNEEIMNRTGLSMRSIYNNLSEAIKLLRSVMTSPNSNKFGRIA